MMVAIIGVDLPHALLQELLQHDPKQEIASVFDLSCDWLLPVIAIDLPELPIYRLQDYMRDLEHPSLKQTVRERMGCHRVIVSRKCKGMGCRKDHFRWHHPKYIKTHPKKRLI